MFRVFGRDAFGAKHEVSVCADTEEEARGFVLGAGKIIEIDRVTIPEPARPQVKLRLSGRVVTIIGCLLCLGFTTLGIVIGAWIGHGLDVTSTDFLKFRWIVGGAVGGILGVVVAVNTLVAFLKRFWSPD